MENKSNISRTEDYFKKFVPEKVIKNCVDNNPIIFDIGSGDGASLKWFAKIFDTFEIHCFEPQVNSYASLTKVSSELASDKISIITNSVAVGNESSYSKKFFYHYPLDSGISGFLKMNTQSKDSVNIQSEKDNGTLDSYLSDFNKTTFVKVIKLSDYIKENSITHIDLLKIDVQGFESEVIKGLDDKLNLVSNILLEINFYDLYERESSFFGIESLIRTFGFRLYDIIHISKNPMNGRTDWVDVLYVKN